MNIFLIGYRGTGKSTVAPLVARELGSNWSALDLDVELERRAERTIAQIFAADGEKAFRDLEEEVLADAGSRDHHIFATGGGVIGRETNRQRLRQGWVAWLTADPRTILGRISTDTTTAGRRPNLTVGGLSEIETILSQREPHYRSLANVALSTDHSPLEQIATQIVTAFRSAHPEYSAKGAAGCP